MEHKKEATEDDGLAALRRVPLFANMDAAQLAAVRAIMRPCAFAPGQTIILEGERGDDFHVIVAGKVQVLTQDAGGRELVLDEAGPGGFFGELSMLTGEPRSARVRAAGPVSTLALGRAPFLDFLVRRPQAAVEVLMVLGRRLSNSDALLRRSVSPNVNVIEEEKLTAADRVADGVATLMGSWTFIIVQTVLLFLWVLLNLVAWVRHWDEYPFVFLNLVLGFQAAYAAPIIMMSQNRASNKDRLAAEVDHQVNVKAEVKAGLLLNRLDDLERGMHHLHNELRGILRERNDAARTDQADRD